MQLPPAAVAALWTVFDRTGIRPEWITPVLYYESGFDPSVQNRAGGAYYGVGQSSAVIVASLGVSPRDYMTWSAKDQIVRAILPFFAKIVAGYGPLRSGTRVYQANLLPATLTRIHALWQVIAWRGSAVYRDNQTFDPLHHGAITLSDLAIAVSRMSERVEVRSAIQAAYAMRPGEHPTSAAYGDDYVDPAWWMLAPLSIGAYALGR